MTDNNQKIIPFLRTESNEDLKKIAEAGTLKIMMNNQAKNFIEKRILIDKLTKDNSR